MRLALEDPIWHLPSAGYFEIENSTPETLRERASSYKSRLASYVLLGVLSFHKAYVTNVVEETLDFH